MTTQTNLYIQYSGWCRNLENNLGLKKIGLPEHTLEGIVNSAVFSGVFNYLLHQGNLAKSVQSSFLAITSKIAVISLTFFFNKLSREKKGFGLINTFFVVISTPRFFNFTPLPKVEQESTITTSILSLFFSICIELQSVDVRAREVALGNILETDILRAPMIYIMQKA